MLKKRCWFVFVWVSIHTGHG